MLNRTCAACGGTLQRAADHTAVCMKCFRTYRLDDPPRVQPTRINQQEKDMEAVDAGVMVAVLVLSLVMMAAFITGAYPLLIGVGVGIGALIKKRREIANEMQFDVREVPVKKTPYFGEYLRTENDCISRLRGLPLGRMPLGTYGEQAAEQLERIRLKKQALHELLGDNHPFIVSFRQAELYVMQNCKQVFFRLKYCDQDDPSLCRVHAHYLRDRIEENNKILRDCENLIIEVTQMDDYKPVPVPSVDVLADTLRQIRTGEQPEDAIYEQYEQMERHSQAQTRMMMR